MNLFSAFDKWNDARIAQNAIKDFKRGYDYAAGALLRGDVPVEYLESQAMGWDGPEPFDRGILKAIYDIETLRGTK